MRVTFMYAVTVLVAQAACGSEVVVDEASSSASTSAVGGGGPGGAGGQAEGGATPVCSEACKSCCNDPACPTELPVTSTPCAPARLFCGYDAPDGCIQLVACQDNDLGWSPFVDPLCPGQCVTGVPFNGEPCPAPGEVCTEEVDVGGELRCYEFVCQDDFSYSEPTFELGTCP
ncbi:MAG: hypothetical protein AAGN82_29040 [Myxococcota bacterium]